MASSGIEGPVGVAPGTTRVRAPCGETIVLDAALSSQLGTGMSVSATCPCGKQVMIVAGSGGEAPPVTEEA